MPVTASRAALFRKAENSSALEFDPVGTMSAPDHERRHDRRLKLRVPVEIHTETSQTPMRGATSDLSLSGCYIESIFPFPVGATLELKLQIDGTLLVLATVVTSDPQVGNGIQFMKMLPEDIAELSAFLESAQKEEEKHNGSAG
jgi:hypothetical protein